MIQKVDEVELNIRLAARLKQVVSSQLSDTGRKDIATAVSEHALQVAELVFPPLDRSVHYIRKQFIGCLLEADRSEVALPQIQLALQTIYSSDFAKQYTKPEYESAIVTIHQLQLITLYLLRSPELTATIKLLVEQVRQSGSSWLLAESRCKANGHVLRGRRRIDSVTIAKQD